MSDNRSWHVARVSSGSMTQIESSPMKPGRFSIGGLILHRKILTQVTEKESADKLVAIPATSTMSPI